MSASVSDAFGEEAFRAIARIWDATGVGNPARGDTYESVQATLAHGGRIFTVVVDGAIVAVCWITDDGRRLYLHHMAVAPEEQGKGHARALMERALAYARQRRLQMKLEVHRDNLRAKRLYQSFGFASLGDYEVFIRRDLSG
jgi:[ribosomal protein S18]-alanine N-acetyltransferase